MHSSDSGRRGGRGGGRFGGRRGRRGGRYDNDGADDGSMTLEEWEATQKAAKATTSEGGHCSLYNVPHSIFYSLLRHNHFHALCILFIVLLLCCYVSDCLFSTF